MNKYEISEPELRALLEYLAQKPYKEVAPLVANLVKLKLIKQEPQETKEN